jgi:hypothetical protein
LPPPSPSPAASGGSRLSRNIRYTPELPFLGGDISTADVTSVGSPSPTPNWKSRYLNEFMDVREGP